MQWAFRECLDHYAFQLKHGQTTCMDCGHTWTTDEDTDKCVCPKCKKKAGGEIDSNTSTKWWSSNVGTKASSTTGAFLLELSSSGKCEIWVDGYGSKNRVRPILAF